jgi:AcrR family transcriptional regulator
LFVPRTRRIAIETLSPRLRHVLRDLEQIIISEGFLHLDTATLAKRLRCSKRALYKLAPTQERLLVMVIDRVLARTDEYLAGVAKRAPDWRSALTNYMAAMVQTSRPASPRFLHDINSFPAGLQLLRRLQRRTVDRLEQILRAGIAANAFNDVSPKLVAELILMVAGRFIDTEFLRALGLTLAEAYEELSRLVDHGLLPHRDTLMPDQRVLQAAPSAASDGAGPAPDKRRTKPRSGAAARRNARG